MGYANTSAPSASAASAQLTGTRAGGYANIEKPVLIASGGKTIFRRETGLCASRRRQPTTTAAPKSEPKTKSVWRSGIGRGRRMHPSRAMTKESEAIEPLEARIDGVS